METEPLDADPYNCMGQILVSITSNGIDMKFSMFIVVMIILLIISGLISGSEVAFFSISDRLKNRMESSKRKSDKDILRVISKPKELLATILIVNNIVNLSIIILFTFTLLTYFRHSQNQVIAFLIEVVLVTFLIIIFGELIPKIYARQYNVRFARIMVVPLSFLINVFYPLSRVLIRMTSIVEKRVNRRNQNVSIEDLKQVIEITSDDNSNVEDKKILERIVTFSNVYVKQIMTSRIDVVAFDSNRNFKDVMVQIKENKFSRVPVYEENFDNIKGVLYIKDLIPHFDKSKDFAWQKLMRKPYFVPENKKIDDLLREFQSKKVHMAVVVDEYGGFSGIITLEDILEEIVGEISDEFDQDEQILVKKIDDKTLMINAKLPLTDVTKLLNLPDDKFEDLRGESETIGGLMTEVLGKIPSRGEKVMVGKYLFVAETVDKKRVMEVRVSLAN